MLRERGLTYEEQCNVRARLEAAIERDARIGFARLLRELRLDQAEHEPYRFIAGI